jgi:Amidase
MSFAFSFSTPHIGFVRAFASWIIRNFIGDTKFASFLARSHNKSVRQYHDYVADKLKFERQTRATLWDTSPNLPLDAVIAPVQAVPALPHGGCDHLSPLACSTLLYNVVNLPVGAVPVTRVDATRDALSDIWRNAPGNGSKLLEAKIYGPKGAYNPRAMDGLPVGVQIIGQPWGEEKVLAIMHVVDAALGPRGFGPGSWAPRKQVGGASRRGGLFCVVPSREAVSVRRIQGNDLIKPSFFAVGVGQGEFRHLSWS